MEEKDYKKLYEDVVALAKDGLKDGLYLSHSAKEVTEYLFPQLKETEDEKARRKLTRFLINFNNGCYSRPSENEIDSWLKWIDKKYEKNNLLNFDEAEKEKNDFVSGHFIECRKSFNEFKELESYLFEYVGDDTYIGKSDNILGQRFHITPRQLFTLFTHEHCKKCYEKQGEQKPIDMIEPKFHEGEWVVNRFGDVWHIDSFDGKNYQVSNGDKHCYLPIERQGEMHLWTILDAKDGDVLAANECYVIFKEIDWLNIKCHCEYHYMNNPMFFVNTFQNKDAFYPATKEQRDLLFQKMHESGYEWDAEKKELKKIEQASTWSKEDELMIQDAIHWINEFQKSNRCKDENDMQNSVTCENWLKSLKEKIQPNRELSKEDRERILRIYEFVGQIEKAAPMKSISKNKM